MLSVHLVAALPRKPKMATKTIGKRKPKKRVEKLRTCPSSEAFVNAAKARSSLVGRPPGAGGASGVLIWLVVVLTKYPALSDVWIDGVLADATRRGAACRSDRGRHPPARRGVPPQAS